MTPDKTVPKIVKVAIGIPCMDMVYTHFAMSLLNLYSYSLLNNVMVSVITQQSALLTAGRNEIVATAKQLKADKLLFIDSDMTFPKEALCRLLALQSKYGVEILGTDALQRREPFDSVITAMDGKKVDYKNLKKTQILEVKGGSTAFQLIDMKVFDKLKEPYYDAPFVKEGPKHFLGEDYYFSNKARTAGLKVYIDVALSPYIGHVGVKPFFLKDKKPQSIMEKVQASLPSSTKA